VLAWIVVNPLSGGPGINQGGIMTVTHALRNDPKDRRALPPMMILAAEHYNRIARLLERKLPVRLEVDISTRFSDEMPGAFNVIAEIPGVKKKDEIVMIGAHLDSWTGGTGATDNAAGVATVMEAMRVLSTLELPMDRTVRVALWSAEEASALGSREYVRTHFGDRDAAGYKEFCCYFNIDGGSGKIRGMFATNSDAARPVLKAWLAPFEDLGVTTVSPRNGGGSDHGAFDQAGLPGFDMLLDPLDYGSTTHHTNMDTYDRLRPGDLMHNAAVLASIVYHAATRVDPLPRKGVPGASASR
jgi:carboxypeptidase Q